jgi:pyruvate-ferredoxin/flavodoxin oxidoreductase
MQGAAFQGGFFWVSPLLEREQLYEEKLFEGIRGQLQKHFGHRGQRVVEDNLRVIRRGFDEVRELDWALLDKEAEEQDPAVSDRIASGDAPRAESALSDRHRFFEQVCERYRRGSDPLADPFAALSAIPAATGVFRDMSDIRMEVPKFVPDKCTGCGQCWVQCPDAAIPGLVTEVEPILSAAVELAGQGRSLERIRPLIDPLAAEVRERLDAGPFTCFTDVLRNAYGHVALRYPLDPEQRNELDDEFARLMAVLADFPVAKTSPFYSVPEAQQKGNGGLLSVTVNPKACKGCNLCVDVCAPGALVTVKQDEAMAESLRRNWSLWERLPDTPDRFVNVRDYEKGIGVLHTLLLKKRNYSSMVGGDGACNGCGEKTTMHLIVAAVEAAMQERVRPFVERVGTLARKLEERVGGLLVSGADLDSVASDAEVHLDVALSGQTRSHLNRLLLLIKQLKDLAWRYTSGPGGRGRAALGMTNATGCSSVWASTYPYNPYPFPWVNHLFQDAPSIAIGIFEGQMRKMADAFRAVREAELELEGAYDPEVHEPFFTAFDWRQFTDEEFLLCPPIFAVGGDGAMLDIGFQNLSRLLASGKPLRTIVLDTQVYSNTGGQACTAGYTGQVSDMAAYGSAQHGKEEARKELSLLAIAHRNCFVLQTSQTSHSHLLSGVLRGLASRRPAIFNIYTPCPPEHGIPDEGSARAARLALESRAFPLLVYDPDAGPSLADRLDLEGNPALRDPGPSYEISYRGGTGAEKRMTLPLTIADWAATEARFAKHFTRRERSSWGENMIPFHEYLELAENDRTAKVPFVYALDSERHLDRLVVSDEIVTLAEERRELWSQLKEMAGVEPCPRVREEVATNVEREHEKRESALRAKYETKLSDQRAEQAKVIVSRIVTGLFGDAVAPGAQSRSRPPRADGNAPTLLQDAATTPAARAANAEIVGEERKPAGGEPPSIRASRGGTNPDVVSGGKRRAPPG